MAQEINGWVVVFRRHGNEDESYKGKKRKRAEEPHVGQLSTLFVSGSYSMKTKRSVKYLLKN